ncbi:MAG: phage major capsid protein [Caulobacteraceae bacterium]|nr:phage major capsid protein [Caulobacteraceae bacterium]
MPTKQELVDKRNGLIAEYRKVCEITPENWTSDVETRANGLDEQIKGVEGELDALNKSEEARAARVARLAELEAKDRANRGDRRVGVDANDRRQADPEVAARTADEVRGLALQAYFKVGRGEEINEEQRNACRAMGFNPTVREIEIRGKVEYGEPAWSFQGSNRTREVRAGLDVATSGAGKETIPQGFMYELERKMLAFARVRNVARVFKTDSGNDMPYPTVDDTSNTGELLAEATTFGTSVDPTFAAITFKAYKFSSKPIFVSQEILEDSAFNLSAEISSLLAERFGRVEASYMTTGTGTSQPKGVVTETTFSAQGATTTAFGADDLIDTFHSLDPAYRDMSSVGWMMHDTVLKFIRKLKDSTGQYLWQPGLIAGAPDTLLGKPVTINQQMSSTFTTGQKLVVIGAFEKFLIRDVANIRLYRLDERYRDTDQTAFIGFKRLDARAIQAAAFKGLKLA